MQVWQTPVRQLQRLGTSQASASFEHAVRAGVNGVAMPLRAKVTSGPVPAGPDGWCGGRVVRSVTPGVIGGSAPNTSV